MPLHDWSPATQLAKLDRDFEDILNNFLRHDWAAGKDSATSLRPPAIESFIDPDRLVIRVDLPGIDPKDVDIKLEESLLTIRASREADAEEHARNFVHREIRYGSFERTISIPKGVKQEDISAASRHGVLELTIPLESAMGVRKVPAQRSGHAREPERGP